MALIWWTDQVAAESVQRMVDTKDPQIANWPAYLAEQFGSRLGRPGRGRLWAADCFVGDDVKVADHLFNSPVGRWLGMMAGIVIHNHHLDAVIALPGVVTDFELVRR